LVQQANHRASLLPLP